MDAQAEGPELKGSPALNERDAPPDSGAFGLIDNEGERPKQSRCVQVSRQKNPSGETIYVLHNPDTESYLEVDDRNYFLWSLMTGKKTECDLSEDYYAEYRCFPADRLGLLLEALKANHLLEECPEEGHSGQPASSANAGSRLQRWAEATFQKTFPLPNADRFYGALYGLGGRYLFSKSALLFFLVLSLAGFSSFVVLEASRVFGLHIRLSFQGLRLLFLLLFTIVMVFIHESAHALACKHFGRKVLGAGVMFYYGMPAFYVDATDTWMSGERERIAVALAGPASTVVVAGALSLVAAFLPVSPATLALFQMAFIGYLAVLFNLNPLLELDGYYVLEDLLGINDLRGKAFAYVRHTLWTKLLHCGGFGRTDVLLTAFGALSLSYSAFAVWLALYLWENHLHQILGGLRMGQDWLSLVLLGGLTLAAGTALVMGLAARALLLLSAAGKFLTLSHSRPRKEEA